MLVSSQGTGGCCANASATKEELEPVPSAAAGRSGKSHAPATDGPPDPTANGGGAVPAAAGPPVVSQSAKAAAQVAPAAASGATPVANGGDQKQKLEGEARVRPPKPSATVADKTAGLPTISGQRRANAIAAENGVGQERSGANCVSRVYFTCEGCRHACGRASGSSRWVRFPLCGSCTHVCKLSNTQDACGGARW